MTDTPAAAGTPEYLADAIVERYLELCDKQLGGAGVNYGTAENEERDLILPIRAIEDALSACRAELAERDEDERRLLEDITKLGKEAEESERLLAARDMDAEAFQYLQNAPVVEAQAFFWNIASRSQRRKAILQAAIAGKEPTK